MSGTLWRKCIFPPAGSSEATRGVNRFIIFHFGQIKRPNYNFWTITIVYQFYREIFIFSNKSFKSDRNGFQKVKKGYKGEIDIEFTARMSRNTCFVLFLMKMVHFL